LSPLLISVLTLAALGAGFIDAIAGGGGLITVPALLAAGLPPHLALGTNKGQSVFGSGAALVRFARAGLIEKRASVPLFALGLLGSWVGAALALWLESAVLRPIVLVLLVAVTPLIFVRVRPAAFGSRLTRLGPLALAVVVGAYDGFFGPGTGTLLILGFVALGRSPVAATAEAKVINFASNLAALSLFAYRGNVLLAVALPMAGAQLVGGHLGAHAAVRGGERVVKAVLTLVVVALVLKLARDVWLVSS
jgi:hypothetical protein